MLSTLTFDVDFQVESTDDDRPFITALITPKVDGGFLFKNGNGPLFDAVAVIVREATPDSFNPFTCSCGEAGCAGIFEEVRLSADEHTVTWTFPEDYFRGRLSHTLFPADAPLRLTFEKQSYLASLTGLTQRLVQLEQEHKLPVVLPPVTFPEDYLDQTVEETLAHARSWFAGYLEREAKRQSLFGPLLHLELHAHFPNGYVCSFSVEGLAYDLARVDNPDAPKAECEANLERLVPEWRADASALLSDVKQAAWADIEYRAWSLEEPTEDCRDTDKLVELWPQARLELLAD